MAITKMKEVRCPSCGASLNAATGAEDSNAKPSAGDMSICVECGTALEFYVTTFLSVRLLDESQLGPDDIQRLTNAKIHAQEIVNGKS